MEIKVRRNGDYCQIDINIQGFSCDMGLLDEQEAREFIDELLGASQEIINCFN